VASGEGETWQGIGNDEPKMLLKFGTSQFWNSKCVDVNE
jgi:hypothetical protein